MDVAETQLTGRPYDETLREFALEHPDTDFGGMLRQWFTTQGSKPYNSFDNLREPNETPSPRQAVPAIYRLACIAARDAGQITGRWLEYNIQV